MIKRYSFTGSSTADALLKAKAELGDDFAIEVTKQIRAKTLNQDPLFEVVVCVEEEQNPLSELNKAEQVNDIKRQIEAYTNLGKNRQTSQSTPKTTPKEQWQDEDVSMSISRVANEIKNLASANDSEPSPLNIQPDYSAKMRDMEKKLDKLNDKLSLIADAVWEDKKEARGEIVIPPEFATIYKKAASSGMKSEHLKAIMEVTIANMPSSMKNNPSAIERYFYFLLEKMLPSKKIMLSQKKQKIIMY
ncbi:MAG: hypothetical protein ACI35K_07415 [Campylobacter sp.]